MADTERQQYVMEAIANCLQLCLSLNEDDDTDTVEAGLLKAAVMILQSINAIEHTRAAKLNPAVN